MEREKAQAAQTARPKVSMLQSGSDCSIVVMKRGNARGAKGAGHRHWARVDTSRHTAASRGKGPSRPTTAVQLHTERPGPRFAERATVRPSPLCICGPNPNQSCGINLVPRE